MIFSSINLNGNNKNYAPAIIKAINFLKNTNFDNLEDGVYEIDGKNIFAQVFHKQTQEFNNTRPETHEKYLDLQYLISGEEKIGTAILTTEYEIDEKIDERDLIFYKRAYNETFITMKPGYFCVFFTDDVHRPAVAFDKPIEIRKVVVKINASII